MHSALLAGCLLGSFVGATDTGGTGNDGVSHHHRGLQSDPCIANEADAKLFTYSLAPTVTYFRTSYFERCVESFQFDDNGAMMIDHITGLSSVFAEYHSFYDISKDPEASNPLNYQAELGYKVYAENSGKVDLRAGLQDILDEIYATGVSGQATFWNITSLVNRLRDAHIQLKQWSLYPAVEMTIVPQRIIDYSSTGDAYMTPIFTLDDSAQLQLQLQFSYDSNRDDEAVNVVTINGMSVQEFMTGLADGYAISLGYQSQGARINAMLNNMRPFDFPLGYFLVTGRPSDVVPDSFEVVYDDGTTETFYSSVALDETMSMFSLDSLSGYSVNRTLYEVAVSLPGSVRLYFDLAMSRITSAPYIPVSMPQKVSIKEVVKQTSFYRKTRRVQERNYQFIDIIPSEIDGIDSAAYTIEGDYAVLKLESFMLLPSQTAQIYRQVAQAAKDAGVTKLMVDVSNNGGGVAVSGLTLAHLMYPKVDIMTWFRNRWSVRYNSQMASFTSYGVPLISDLSLLILNNTLAESFRATLVDTTSDAIETAAITIENMANLCTSNGFACQLFLPGLKAAMASYALAQTSENFQDLLLDLFAVLLFINPWTVGLPQSWLFDLQGFLEFVDGMKINEVNYGGTTSSFTQRFDLELLSSNSTGSLDDMAALVAATTDALDGFTFDEFLIVSNGNSGSTTSIFVSTVEQIWKNRDRSGVTQPLRTLTFGGSGRSEDIALASFPASIRDVNLDYPLVTFAAIFAWEVLVSGNSPYSASVNEVRKAYGDVVGIPPYFASGVPTLPVVTYFDTFMGPDSLPMQYIHMPPDVYIPNMYPGVSFEDATDLAEMYAAASGNFPSNGNDGGGDIGIIGVGDAGGGNDDQNGITVVRSTGTSSLASSALVTSIISVSGGAWWALF